MKQLMVSLVGTEEQVAQILSELEFKHKEYLVEFDAVVKDW
jgi:hypothetical protein